MKKKLRFPIRIKLAIMLMVTIAVAVATLGVFLLVSFSNAAYETARSTLSSVATNASLALENSVSSSEASMKLLANQIGYDYDFANNIEQVETSTTAKTKVTEALQGKDGKGDGSTIFGAMDYLLKTNPDFISATMYSPFVTNPIQSRLLPLQESQQERYNELLERPGQAKWFFVDDNLYVWKALINFAIVDTYEMKVVGFIEYSLNKESFLTCLSDTRYENEGMLLLDDNGENVFSLSSGDKEVDKAVMINARSIKKGSSNTKTYSVYRRDFDEKGWSYISFINHESVNKTSRQGQIATAIIIGISVLLAGGAAILLSAKEIKRIKDLSKASGEIAQGDYSVRLNNKANDEITDLGESFNVMAEKVQQALNDLVLQSDSISENFATILSNKSGESGNHVKRVSEYSAILAEEMGFNESEVHDIRIASMLHDVGKIMIDESILHKPGKFTDEEYKIMQQHVVYGGKLLKGVPGNIMQLGAIIAECHHERWDGNGYVQGLKGDDIPKAAQITSVADVFDALVSKRCYKGAWTIEEAYNEIVAQSGKQFSPAAVEAFQKRFEDFKKIAEIYKDEEE